MAAIFANPMLLRPQPQPQPQPPATVDKAAAGPRYCVLNEVNRGAYGVVHRALDMVTRQLVAMKHEIDGLSQSTKREISILESLPRHPCVVEFKEVVTDDRGHVLVVMEYLPTDLERLINEKTRMPFTLSEVKTMTRQILEGVAFLHSNGVMHRDLKPSNILLTADRAHLKLCDFGLSRHVDREGSYTPGVVTQWYRAPELLLMGWFYSTAIDMWSVGCIMAELLLGEVAFHGESEIDQLYCIDENMEESGKLLRARLCDAAGARRGPVLSELGVDLLLRMLEMDAEKRISAKEALDHPWFREFYGLQLED